MSVNNYKKQINQMQGGGMPGYTGYKPQQDDSLQPNVQREGGSRIPGTPSPALTEQDIPATCRALNPRTSSESPTAKPAPLPSAAKSLAATTKAPTTDSRALRSKLIKTSEMCR